MPEPRSTPVTVPAVRAAKRRDGHPPLVMVTAYDAPGARIADAAGVDIILVGDSVANNVLGYEDNLQVTVEDMAHHTAAVARARPKPLIVADLPWMSYHLDPVDTVRNAAVLIRAGAQAVKLEGGANRVPMIEALVAGRDPGDGPPRASPRSRSTPWGATGSRVGTTPPPTPWPSGPRPSSAAGCFAVVIEGVPERVGRGHHRFAGGADHRDRGRPGLRRPGPGLPRPARVQRHGAQVRAPLRRAGRRPPPRRWPPTPPMCAPGPSRPTPRSTTEH